MVEVADKAADRVVARVIEREMTQSYVDYAMSVLVGRALPDVRDGLKPVQRRILYTMLRTGLLHSKPYRKSANIVGNCMARYHPHGDAAIYDALARMAQSFSLRYPLVDGQGNWGSVDGDPQASMRYCVTGDTLLLTDRGMVPIKELSPERGDLIDVNILNYQGKTKKAIKFFNSGEHEIIKIKTEQGYEIKGSLNHPLLCWCLNEFGMPCLRWKLLEEITDKDYVMINRNFSLFSKENQSLVEFFPSFSATEKKISLPETMDNSLAFLLGALVSEGSFHQNKVLFNNKDAFFYDEVKKSILQNFPQVTLYERDIKGGCKELDLYHQKVVRFLINLGLKPVKSDLKEIPSVILTSKRETVKHFLMALFEGDGSVSSLADKRNEGKHMELAYHSKSRKLVSQLKTLLLNFGIVTTAPYEDKRNGCYKLIISGAENIGLFKKEIGFFSSRKRDILASVKEMNKFRMSRTDYIPFLNDYLRNNYSVDFVKNHNFDRYNNLEKNHQRLVSLLKPVDMKMVFWLLKHKYFFNRVRTVERLPEKETVYSIKVDSGCHSFVANGFINHNTEAKLKKLSEELLQDIDKETVDFVPNFDGSAKEPVVLPSKAPNLLINGSSGIAVGMATNIPPHNVVEVCDAAISSIKNPDIDVSGLMQFIKGPDFPTGAIICGGSGIKEAYETGRGVVRVRSRVDVDEENSRIIVSEIPFMVNKAMMIEEIAGLVRDGVVKGISDLRDESSRAGIRVVIGLRRDANPDVVLNQLFKHSRLQSVFGINLVALVDAQPVTLNLKQIICHFVSHRKDVVTRKTAFDLEKAKEQAHILEGIIIALNNIDAVVEGIRKSEDIEHAKVFLMSSFSLTDKQASAILEMRLSRLASLERQKVRDEHKGLLELITELAAILGSEQRIMDIVVSELEEIKAKYGDKRRTMLSSDGVELDVEDLIKQEDMVITVTHTGYIKRLPVSTYRAQHRGGKGITALSTKEQDFVEDLFIANTHSYILFFTDKGRVYWLKVYEIPEASRQSMGKAVVNLLDVKDEKITAFIPVKDFAKGYLIMATKKGTVKKTDLQAFSRPRKGGIIAIGLNEDDSLVSVCLTTGSEQLIVATSNGKAVRFNESDVRASGRSSTGVRGVRLDEDEVVAMVVADPGKTLLTITESGFGKRSPVEDYRLVSRGGSGVINIQTPDRNGRVVDVKAVSDNDELVIISKNGSIIRVPVKDLRVIGRNTQGFRIMKLDDGDKVVAAAKIVNE